MVKNLPANAGDIREMWVRSLGLGRPPEGGHGNLLWYPCLENPMDSLLAVPIGSQRAGHD